jgi:hypothetical protein
MKERKMKNDPWYLSKRLYGAALLVICAALQGMKVDIDAQTQTAMVDQIYNIASAVSGIVGTILSIWSKAKESKK